MVIGQSIGLVRGVRWWTMTRLVSSIRVALIRMVMQPIGRAFSAVTLIAVKSIVLTVYVMTSSFSLAWCGPTGLPCWLYWDNFWLRVRLGRRRFDC